MKNIPISPMGYKNVGILLAGGFGNTIKSISS